MQLHAVADIARGARLRRRSRDELRHVRDLALVRPLERVPRLQDLGVRAVLVVGQALAAHLAALRTPGMPGTHMTSAHQIGYVGAARSRGAHTVISIWLRGCRNKQK